MEAFNHPPPARASGGCRPSALHRPRRAPAPRPRNWRAHRRLMVTHCRKVLGRQPDGYDPEMCHAGPPKGVVCGENADSVSRAEEDVDSEVTEKEPADAFKLAAWTTLLRLIELSHSPAAHHRRVLRHRAFLALAGQLLLDLEGLAGAVEVLAEATP